MTDERLGYLDGPTLRRNGPVKIIQSDTDPGDWGEPREWDTDGVTYIVVPSFALWASPPAGLDVERLTKAIRDVLEHTSFRAWIGVEPPYTEEIAGRIAARYDRGDAS